MNERAPKLSIGLPVYNGEKYLPDALDDLLGQDYEDFELIISSNASTDGTDEICREYASKDRRVSHSRNDCNIGATPNWNRVAQLAHGEFFKWAMHDDECDRTLFNWRRLMRWRHPFRKRVGLAGWSQQSEESACSTDASDLYLAHWL